MTNDFKAGDFVWLDKDIYEVAWVDGEYCIVSDAHSDAANVVGRRAHYTDLELVDDFDDDEES